MKEYQKPQIEEIKFTTMDTIASGKTDIGSEEVEGEG